MKCKIYCYEHGSTCDLVFYIKDFGVISIEHYELDNEFLKEQWKDLREFESSENVKFIKTYIGEV